MEKTILLLHGFASSGKGAKAQYLSAKCSVLPRVDFHAFDFNPAPKDFEYMTVTGMINRLRQYMLDHHLENVSLIGSSMGALVGLHYAHRFGGVERLLLLAPALFYRFGGLSEEALEQWQQKGVEPVFHFAFEREIPLRYDVVVDGRRYVEPVSPPAPILIIHGRHDDVVPIDLSRQYVASFPNRARLIEVDSDHRLNDQLDLVWEHARSFLGLGESG